MLDEREFLSPYGIRSLSRIHKDEPYVFQADGQEFRVDYVPDESNAGLFGGNATTIFTGMTYGWNARSGPAAC